MNIEIISPSPQQSEPPSSFSFNHMYCATFSTLAILLLMGCNRQSNQERSELRARVIESSATSDPAESVRPAPKILPADMPSVVLSAQHAAVCFVKVGDALPNFQLPDARGKLQAFKSLQGERLTIVMIWSANRPESVTQILEVAIEIAEPYSSLGVVAVAINPLDTPVAAAQALDDFSPDFPLLFDSGGTYFKQLGEGHLPRTYLLDKRGRILWFDIEYSRSTRRQLEQAIHAALGAT